MAQFWSNVKSSTRIQLEVYWMLYCFYSFLLGTFFFDSLSSNRKSYINWYNWEIMGHPVVTCNSQCLRWFILKRLNYASCWYNVSYNSQIDLWHRRNQRRAKTRDHLPTHILYQLFNILKAVRVCLHIFCCDNYLVGKSASCCRVELVTVGCNFKLLS